MFDIVQSAISSYLPWMIVLFVVVFYFVKIVKAFVRWRQRENRVAKALEAFPGPPKHWLFGNLHQIPSSNEDRIMWFRQLREKYPRGMTIWLGPLRPTLIICHTDLCKTILRSTEPKQVSGLGGYTLLKPWLGDGLLLSSGQKWFRNRRLLTPGFHFDVLKPYMQIYNRATDIFLTKFATAVTGYKSVEVFQPVSLCTLDVILKCAFSSDMNVQTQGENNPYVNAVIRIANLIMKRTLNPLLYPNIIYNMTPSGREFNRLRKLTHDVSSDVIQKRKRALNTSPADEKKRYPDFLDILLLAIDDEDKGLTDMEIRDEVDTFLFEGHDTTASAISWALHTLADHPEHQQKCYEEISKVLSGRDTDEILWDDLNHFSYLTLCIKESMRLHAPVPLIGREIEKELDLDGVRLPAGTNVQVSIIGVHNNPAVWGSDVTVFRPERFDTDLMSDVDSFSFVPFSAGPRNCIGQNFAMHEIKVILAKTINRYKLTVNPKYPALHVGELVMRSEHGLHVFFTERIKAK